MDNICIKAIITLTVGYLGLVAMFLGYKIKADKKNITLEKNDQLNEQRIKQLETEVSVLKKVIESRSKQEQNRSS